MNKENIIDFLKNRNISGEEANIFFDTWISYKANLINNFWNKEKLQKEKPLDPDFVLYLTDRNFSEQEAKDWLGYCLKFKWSHENWLIVYWPYWECEEFVRNHDLTLEDESFLEIIYKHIENSEIEEAGGLLLERIDESFERDKFFEVDELISKIDISKLNPTLMVGLLSFTYSGKDKLRNRPLMVSKIEEKLTKDCPDRVQKLMENLR